jgi:hypothetical protein
MHCLPRIKNPISIHIGNKWSTQPQGCNPARRRPQQPQKEAGKCLRQNEHSNKEGNPALTGVPGECAGSCAIRRNDLIDPIDLIDKCRKRLLPFSPCKADHRPVNPVNRVNKVIFHPSVACPCNQEMRGTPRTHPWQICGGALPCHNPDILVLRRVAALHVLLCVLSAVAR